ncbi:hypothetical protein [uncultured Clostridium sp.]|uniref:hypothetical protein n=1 Tax=uncultured Clostridium sp. TaxID=59620 RepID=UPI0027DB6B4B|nr:hypothetical protein [uncultured Clostridium sp.]
MSKQNLKEMYTKKQEELKSIDEKIEKLRVKRNKINSEMKDIQTQIELDNINALKLTLGKDISIEKLVAAISNGTIDVSNIKNNNVEQHTEQIQPNTEHQPVQHSYIND